MSEFKTALREINVDDLPTDLVERLRNAALPDVLDGPGFKSLPADLKTLPPALIVGAAFGITLISVCRLIQEAVDKCVRDHRRKALLAAYRDRRRWRKADVPKLEELGISPVAARRLARIREAKGRSNAGRGVVRSYNQLDEAIAAFLQLASEFFEAETSPRRRIAILKMTPLWPLIVEALYRGEYHALKASGASAASTTAEAFIAASLGISTAVVRKLCTDVRRIVEDDSLPPIELTAFETWSRTGDIEHALPQTASADRVEARRHMTSRLTRALPGRRGRH